jgi:hypothetical protein
LDLELQTPSVCVILYWIETDQISHSTVLLKRNIYFPKKKNVKDRLLCECGENEDSLNVHALMHNLPNVLTINEMLQIKSTMYTFINICLPIYVQCTDSRRTARATEMTSRLIPLCLTVLPLMVLSS